MTRIVAALGVVIAILLAPSGASACSCVEVPIQEEFDFSTAVFAGEVTDIQVVQVDCGDDLQITVTVTDCWKGDVEGTAIVYTAGDEGCCGMVFEQGVEYLIWATDGVIPELWTGLCSRTQPIASAGADLAWLGASSCGVSPTAPVSWTVLKDVYR